MGTKIVKIDTGTPGFDIDGKTYTYDVGDPDAPPDPNYPIATDHGSFPVDNNDPPRKDISKTTKKTLADYLGKKTAVNYIPLDVVATSVKITADNNETPTIPSPEHTTENSKWFTQGKRNIAASTTSSPGLKNWMTRGHPEDKKYVPIDEKSSKIRKGKEAGSEPGSVTGNALLPQVEGGLPNQGLGTVKNYTTSVLNNNRFTAEVQFADAFGKNSNPTLHSPKYGTFAVNRLAQVGVSLSIRASRELNSAAGNSNPSSAGQEAKAILPSFNQLGAERIDVALLEAHDVLTSISNSPIPNANFTNISDLSWGSMNNSLDNYDGMSAMGMVALSAALTASINLLFEGLGFILGLAKSTPEPRKNPDGRYILGRSTVTKHQQTSGFGALLSLDIASLLGIRYTITPLKKAVSAGVHAFFGIDEDAGLLGSLVQSVTKPNDSPGYNSVVARAIIRSIVTIIAQVKKAFTGNLISAVKKILALVDVLKSSKLISAINVFAALGDAIKTENPDDVVPGRDEEPIRKSRIDKINDDVPGASSMKSRMGDGTDLKLAWASNRSPSLYLLPNAVAGLQPVAGALGGFQSGYGLQEQKTRSYYRLLSDDEAKTNGNRIPHGDSEPTSDINTLQKIENMLDAEYVPFYFHDVRTNEVISFHAFLSSLTDDYAASYESTEGYGRVEPVKIYKNTIRKIGLSFYVASTSPADFDDMWVKINKLVTLVYPQYTEGRRLTDPDSKYSFTQPFSQMIGASPMVRIRLGNLIRSNYSRFALARLFGATLKDAQFGGNALSLDGSKITDLKDKVQDSIKKSEGIWTVTGGGSFDKKDASGGAFSGGKSVSAPYWTIDGDAAYVPCKVDKFDQSSPFFITVIPDVPDANFLQEIGIADVVQQSMIIQRIKQKFNNIDDPKNYIIGTKYNVPISSLKPTPETAKKIFNKAFSQETEAVSDLTKFLHIENNAIVKSFRSAGGKGLAGFIDSLNFDWYDKVTWDTDPGKKAPKMCKVTISFSPTHDISPGLDSQGYNRSPIYPVGYFAHGIDQEKKNG